jgi:hypothetical protein
MCKRKLKVISQELVNEIELPRLTKRIIEFARTNAGKKIIINYLIRAMGDMTVYGIPATELLIQYLYTEAGEITYQEIIDLLEDYIIKEIESMKDAEKAIFNLNFIKAFKIRMASLFNNVILTKNIAELILNKLMDLVEKNQEKPQEEKLLAAEIAIDLYKKGYVKEAIMIYKLTKT